MTISCRTFSAIFQRTSYVGFELPIIRFYAGKRAKRLAVRVVPMQMLVFSFHKNDLALWKISHYLQIIVVILFRGKQ